MSKNKNERKKNIVNSGVANATVDVVDRYGSGVKEHVVAYSGVDNETGKALTKGLKDISKSKINPEYQKQNENQQAGFAAEVKAVARENAEKAVNGDNSSRTTRTDDMQKQSDGKGGTVGGVNETIYDLAELDSNGTYIENSGRQLKFVGDNGKECTEKLLSKKYDKYRDADAKFEVPSDYYDDVKDELNKRAEKTKEQIENAKKKGNKDVVAKKEAELEKIEKTKKNLKKSSVSKKEALEARKNPVLSTAKDIGKLSHRAGLDGAKNGALVGGGVSTIRNVVALVKGEQDFEETAVNVVTDTATSAGRGYLISYSGAALKGVMQNAPSKFLQNLSKTNLPSNIINTTLTVGKTLGRYMEGELTGTEFVEELGADGVGTIGSVVGGSIGTAAATAAFGTAATAGTAGAVATVAAFAMPIAAGMIGYAVATAYYDTIVKIFKDADLAHEERIRVETECNEAVALIEEYRKELEVSINAYLKECQESFDKAFIFMEQSYYTGSFEDFIAGTNIINEQLGQEALFKNKEELDAKMFSAEDIEI